MAEDVTGRASGPCPATSWSVRSERVPESRSMDPGPRQDAGCRQHALSDSGLFRLPLSASTPGSPIG